MADTLPAASLSFAARFDQTIRSYESGRFVDAQREGRLLLEIEPSDVRVLSLLATIAQEQGDWTSAIELWSRAARAPGAAATHWNSLGRAFVSGGQIRTAQAAFAEAVRLDPGFAEAFNNLGLTHQE